MKLYLVEVVDRKKVDWERHYGFVVLSRNSTEARRAIARYLAEFHESEIETFTNPEKSSLRVLGDARASLGRDPKVILADNKGA